MRVRVHEFTMAYNEDPEIYVAEPIFLWQQTEKGRWVMENSRDKPVYNISPASRGHVGYRVTIDSDLAEDMATYFYLRWP